MAVERKGVNETVAKWINGKINGAGCAGTAVTIRSDQEEAIVAFKKSVAVYRRAEIALLESPVRDSKAYGAAEKDVRSWAGQVHTFRHHAESRLERQIPKDSALMTWLDSWAADVIFRHKVHSNGRTGYE